MDPRDRADALLSRARSRGAFVVTPDNMTSPFDSANTQQIAREVVDGLDDGETTAVVSSSVVESAVRETGHHLDEPAPTTRLETHPPRPRDHDRDGPRTDELPVAVDQDYVDQGYADRDRANHDHVEEEEVGGLIPTTTQRGRSVVSQRLDGI